MPALLVLELEELEELLVVGVAVGVVEELLAPGVAVAAELLELEELLVVGVAVGVIAELAPGVAVAAEVPELEELLELEVPPVTGTPPPATLLLLTLAVKPMLASLSCRPCIVCSQLAKSPWAEPKFVLLVLDELLLDELLPLLLLFVVFAPRPATIASACLNAKAY